MKQRILKFKYWNTISNIMVNNPTMPYKEDWTIEQLFSDRGWIWLQYTGLKDKNGKEIYEGDIVKFRGTISDEATCIVEFYEGRFIFRIDENSYKDIMGWSHVEIIGNKFEHPELFNKKQ